MSPPVIVPVAGGKGCVKIAVIATGPFVQTFGSMSCSLIMYYCQYLPVIVCPSPSLSLWAFFFSVPLSILLSLSSLTLFCFVLPCVALLSYLASSLDLLFTVNLCLVSIKYKNQEIFFYFSLLDIYI
jgi:hypothetical protein